MQSIFMQGKKSIQLTPQPTALEALRIGQELATVLLDKTRREVRLSHRVALAGTIDGKPPAGFFVFLSFS